MLIKDNNSVQDMVGRIYTLVFQYCHDMFQEDSELSIHRRHKGIQNQRDTPILYHLAYHSLQLNQEEHKFSKHHCRHRRQLQVFYNMVIQCQNYGNLNYKPEI